LKRWINQYCFIILLGWIFCSEAVATFSFDAKEWTLYSQEEYSKNQALLRLAGFDVNDVNDIIRAAKIEDELTGWYAIWFLAQKTGIESIPSLKEALNHPNPNNRCMAARLLGYLGDNSGLETMKKDMEELSQGGYEKISKESIANHHPTGPIAINYKSSRLHYALEAAKVLSEFGDTSGYELALKNAIGSKFSGHRQTAIEVLSELARLDKNVLEEKGIFPEKVLLSVLEKENDSFIINNIIVDAQSFMIPETGNKILEKISQSERFSSEQRQKAKKGIQEIKKRIEIENKIKENEKQL